MKRLIYILPLLLLCGCKNNEATPPDPKVCPSEHVEGYITDEAELPPIKDVYVVASDTACVYRTQVNHVQMIYRKEYGYVGEVRLDIQMEK